MDEIKPAIARNALVTKVKIFTALLVVSLGPLAVSVGIALWAGHVLLLGFWDLSLVILLWGVVMLMFVFAISCFCHFPAVVKAASLLDKAAKQDLLRAISKDAPRMAIAHRWFQTYGNILGFGADALREAPLRSEVELIKKLEATEEAVVTAKLRGDS